MRLQALKNVLNLEAIQRGEDADPVVINSDGTERPLTAHEIALMDAEHERLIAEYENNQYQRDRAKAYPSIVDQLDTLYHGGIDAWKAQVKAIKDKYPKA